MKNLPVVVKVGDHSDPSSVEVLQAVFIASQFENDITILREMADRYSKLGLSPAEVKRKLHEIVSLV